MRIDPTFPNRSTENTAEVRKILKRLGDVAGISRTHAKEEVVETGTVKALGMTFSDVQVPGCLVGDTVEVGGPSDLPVGITVTGNVLVDGWVELRAANNTGSSISIPGRSFKIITRGFGD